ncbi:MAG: branched-chain amino acid ABC transporter permease [Candidatus Pacebacteria bacterium]|nr:branched-chain amino acid ABC transporter permease [Candidatus Paceibacterota bacterium]
MDILPQLIVNSIIAGAIYTVTTLGFNLIYRTAKFFDLGYGAMAVVGAYSLYALAVQNSVSVFIALPLALIIAGLVGVLIHALVYRPLRKRKASNLVLFIASLGVSTVIQALAAIFFSSQFQTLSGLTRDKVYQIGGADITETQVIIFVTGIILTILLMLWLKYTSFGKMIRAVGDDEEVSKIVGVNTNKVIRVVFFIASAIAGLAGIFIGMDTGIEPTMGLSLLLKGIIAAIIGGAGDIYGGVLGAFLLGFVENFGIWKISGEWKDAIAFVLLIVFLIWRPKGILNR